MNSANSLIFSVSSLALTMFASDEIATSVVGMSFDHVLLSVPISYAGPKP